jgi:hypothetical protein
MFYCVQWVVPDISKKRCEVTTSKRRQQSVLTQTIGVLDVFRLIRSFSTASVLKRHISKCVLSFPTAQKTHFLSSFLPAMEVFDVYIVVLSKNTNKLRCCKLIRKFNNKAGGTLYLQGLWATTTSSPSICTFFCKIYKSWKQPMTNLSYQIRGKISFCPTAAFFIPLETKL